MKPKHAMKFALDRWLMQQFSLGNFSTLGGHWPDFTFNSLQIRVRCDAGLHPIWLIALASGDCLIAAISARVLSLIGPPRVSVGTELFSSDEIG
jgi:hypothetical protein